MSLRNDPKMESFEAAKPALAAASVARGAVDFLPIIDISPFLAGGSSSERGRAAQAIRRACIDIGFFYITGHGFPIAELDDALHWGRRFFAVPLNDKLRLRAGSGAGALGYFPLNLGGSGDEYGKVADVKERFSASRELIAGEPEHGRYSAGQSQWPDATMLPGFTDF